MREVLFDCFANPRYCRAQEDRNIWAIYEGIRRIDPHQFTWSSSRARRDHTCERGCEIHDGEVYFKYQVGTGWGEHLKLCAGCTAMILYFAGAEKLPAYSATHWDAEKEETVMLDENGIDIREQSALELRLLLQAQSETPEDTWESLTTERLAAMVWEIPTTKIAEKYGVSDKAVEKRCKKHGIKKPPRGYWPKKAAGKLVPDSEHQPDSTGPTVLIQAIL
jgi:hypothetical protein